MKKINILVFILLISGIFITSVYPDYFFIQFFLTIILVVTGSVILVKTSRNEYPRDFSVTNKLKCILWMLVGGGFVWMKIRQTKVPSDILAKVERYENSLYKKTGEHLSAQKVKHFLRGRELYRVYFIKNNINKYDRSFEFSVAPEATP